MESSRCNYIPRRGIITKEDFVWCKIENKPSRP